MKLWYQSLTKLSTWQSYDRTLRGILDKIKDPGTTIELHGIEKQGGMGDQFRYLELLESVEVLENVHRAMDEGFDAFLIGNIGEPGLREAREVADIPILGLCESGVMMSCMMGGSFSFITINDKFTPRIVENVVRYGIRDRMVSADRMNIPRLLDLDKGFDDPDARKRIMDDFEAAAAKASEGGAEVLIPAGGVVMALLAHWGVYQTSNGTPILNGITNLVKLGEAAVKMNRLAGGFTSKTRSFAPPPPDQIGELRKHYGDYIYPMVKAR